MEERLRVEIWKSTPDSGDPWQTKIGDRPIQTDTPRPGWESLKLLSRESRNDLRDCLIDEPELKKWRVVSRVVFESDSGITRVIGFFDNREQYGWEWHPARPEIIAVGKARPTAGA